MPHYFNCVFGDCVHIALQEPDSFIVTDAHGRDWFCYPVDECSPEDGEPFMAAQELANRIGIVDRGTYFTTLLATAEALSQALSTIPVDCLDEA